MNLNKCKKCQRETDSTTGICSLCRNNGRTEYFKIYDEEKIPTCVQSLKNLMIKSND